MAAASLAKPKAAQQESERARAPPEPGARAASASRKARIEEEARARSTGRKARTEPGRSSLLKPALQLKGLVSSPDDAAEREADRVAEHVVSMPDPAPRASAAASAPLQRAPVRRRRRRARAPSQAPAPAPTSASAGSPAARVMSAVASAASGGAPLSRKSRAYLEPRFGADFAGVKVHTGPQAKQLSGQLGARAFTYGRNIFFNQGEYQPETREGKKLLAHELTHTIQQGGVIQRKAIVQQSTAPRVKAVACGLR